MRYDMDLDELMVLVQRLDYALEQEVILREKLEERVKKLEETITRTIFIDEPNIKFSDNVFTWKEKINDK